MHILDCYACGSVTLGCAHTHGDRTKVAGSVAGFSICLRSCTQGCTGADTPGCAQPRPPRTRRSPADAAAWTCGMRMNAPCTAALPWSAMHNRSRTLMSRRAAALLGCSPTAASTSASGAPTTALRGSSATGAPSATASSAAASSCVSAPGASACAAESCPELKGCVMPPNLCLQPPATWRPAARPRPARRLSLRGGRMQAQHACPHPCGRCLSNRGGVLQALQGRCQAELAVARYTKPAANLKVTHG